MNQQVDIVIVGGGLIGASLILALQGLGFTCLLVEAKAYQGSQAPGLDARSLALSPASQRILASLGLWDLLQTQATAIQMIHVSEQRRFGVARLYGEQHSPLGYVLELDHINQALQQLIPKEQIIAPAELSAVDLKNQVLTMTVDSAEIQVQAKLIVAADGADSAVRTLCNLGSITTAYDQQAIVCNVGLAKPHEHRAYERFTSHGPLALLPMQGNQMSLVWSDKPKIAQELMSFNQALFLQKLQSAFGYRLGRFTELGTRYTYPLKQVLATPKAQWPIVCVGNAAQTLHPVAGQGFNLGLRDIASLVECIAEYGLNAPMLDHYLKRRQHDQQVITQLTHSLVQLFSNRWPGAGLARTMGLIALDNMAPLKSLLARYARGFGGFVPGLVCELALNAEQTP